jgi:16S rRNA (uracil1498-N3)-methyltransferase
LADRFYCAEPPVDGLLTLAEEESRHLARVRRLGEGDQVEVFDGRGRGWRAEVVKVARDGVIVRLAEALLDRTTRCQLTLATAVPKGDRFDWLIEKATELGVARLVPLIAERSVVEPRVSKLDRLRRAVIGAAKQCGRNRLMEIDAPRTWGEVLNSESRDARLVAHPGGLAPAQWPVRGASRAILAVGPEGGFTDIEVEQAQSAGWSMVSLGSTLLRIETAGVAGSSILLALAEGTGGQ